MLTFYDSDKNVFSMNVVNATPALQKKFASLIQKCMFVRPPMLVADSDTHVAFYLENARQLLADLGSEQFFNYVEQKVSNVLFYTKVHDQGILEIFVGSCETDAYYVNVMIFSVVRETPMYRYVWIAMSPSLKIFEGVAKFLVIENRFESPKITDETYTGEPLNENVLSFTLDKEELVSKPDDYDEAVRIRDSYLITKKTCMFLVHVPEKVLVAIRDSYVNRPTEYAGSFVIKSYDLVKRDGRYIPLATLEYLRSSETQGTTVSVVPPSGMFNFHVHPLINYRNNNMMLDSPSPADLRGIVGLYAQDLIAHFVISVEGVYTVRITSEFSSYLKQMISQNVVEYHACLNILTGNVRDAVSNRHFIHEMHNGQMGNYINHINSIRLDDIFSNAASNCRQIADQDFKLFDTSFYSWSDIQSESGITFLVDSVLPQSVGCPPPISREMGKIKQEDINDFI